MFPDKSYTRNRRLRLKPELVQDTDYMAEKTFHLRTIFGTFWGLFNASVTHIGFKGCFHIPKFSLKRGSENLQFSMIFGPKWGLFIAVSVQKVFSYTKMFVGMWRSTHVIFYLVKKPLVLLTKRMKRTIWLGKLTI